jgi:RNA polymerase sigma-70 factor (ECF subfamily)
MKQVNSAMRSPAPRSPSCGETITALVVRFSQGDRAAFKPLFALAWPIVLTYCRRALPNEKDAEDAAQEGLLKVFTRIVDFDPRRDGVGWILGIALYEIKTIRKKRMRRREEHFDHQAVAVSLEPDIEAAAAEREIRAFLPRALEALSPQDKAIIEDILRDVDGPIVPVDARLRKRKQRALERLRLLWRRFHVG